MPQYPTCTRPGCLLLLLNDTVPNMHKTWQFITPSQCHSTQHVQDLAVYYHFSMPQYPTCTRPGSLLPLLNATVPNMYKTWQFITPSQCHSTQHVQDLAVYYHFSMPQYPTCTRPGSLLPLLNATVPNMYKTWQFITTSQCHSTQHVQDLAVYYRFSMPQYPTCTRPGSLLLLLNATVPKMYKTWQFITTSQCHSTQHVQDLAVYYRFSKPQYPTCTRPGSLLPLLKATVPNMHKTWQFIVPSQCHSTQHAQDLAVYYPSSVRQYPTCTRPGSLLPLLNATVPKMYKTWQFITPSQCHSTQHVQDLAVYYSFSMTQYPTCTRPGSSLPLLNATVPNMHKTWQFITPPQCHSTQHAQDLAVYYPSSMSQYPTCTRPGRLLALLNVTVPNMHKTWQFITPPQCHSTQHAQDLAVYYPSSMSQYPTCTRPGRLLPLLNATVPNMHKTWQFITPPQCHSTQHAQDLAVY